MYSPTQSLSKIQPSGFAIGYFGGFSDIQQYPKGSWDFELTALDPG
jgi:hypothetical protein